MHGVGIVTLVCISCDQVRRYSFVSYNLVCYVENLFLPFKCWLYLHVIWEVEWFLDLKSCNSIYNVVPCFAFKLAARNGRR